MLERREVERVLGTERLPKKVVKKAVSIEKEAREVLRALRPEAVRGRVGGPEREREDAAVVVSLLRAEVSVVLGLVGVIVIRHRNRTPSFIRVCLKYYAPRITASDYVIGFTEFTQITSLSARE
jgi:hypothetical protein